MKIKNLDQHEAQALRDQLLLRARTLTGVLETATGKKIDEPKLSSSGGAGTLITDIDSLESHCELLQREINAACKPQTAAPTPPTPAPAQTQAAANKPLTPDEKILAAHGVKTVAELNAKTQRERDLGLRVSLED